MYLKVKVHPQSKENKIIRHDENSFEVFVREKPFDGKANEMVLNLLSEFFHVSRSKLRIVRGGTSRNKTLELLG
jgi:uncharacterized protein (TIGR00251 family)